MTMIDADKAIEVLKGIYQEPVECAGDFAYNAGIGAAISEIRHLKEEAERESND